MTGNDGQRGSPRTRTTGLGGPAVQSQAATPVELEPNRSARSAPQAATFDHALLFATSGANDTDTQRAAGEDHPGRGKHRNAVLAMLRARGPQGATDSELAQHLGIHPGSASKRRLEVCRLGKACDSGQRRLSPSGRKSIVWRAMHSHEPGFGVTASTSKRPPEGIKVLSLVGRVADAATGEVFDVACENGVCVCIACNSTSCPHARVIAA